MECVRERTAKRKEVLEKKSTRALSNKSLFPGIHATTFSEHDLSFLTSLISEVLWKLMT